MRDDWGVERNMLSGCVARPRGVPCDVPYQCLSTVVRFPSRVMPSQWMPFHTIFLTRTLLLHQFLTCLSLPPCSYVFSMDIFPVELCGLTDLQFLALKCTYVHHFPM